MKKRLIALSLFALLTSPQLLAESEVERVLAKYQSQGAKSFSAKKGRSDWNKPVGAEKRACSSCHGSDPQTNGKHIRTQKVIKPMASSINSGRFIKEKKIEKWFKRNCKWAWGRECSAQEKGDFLTYLTSQ